MIIQSYSDISNKCGVVITFRQEECPKLNKRGGPYKGVQAELFQYSEFGFDSVSAEIDPDLDPEIGT